jgi:glycerol-3-phosphate dehydrogenase
MRSYDGPEPDIRCDVVVIGGGINGTGVARDLALRGLSVVLFERNDLAFGASGNNSGMIHGGVRYLSTNPSVTEESCRDSGYIQQIAPFLLHRIPFLLPVRAGPKGRVLLELIDAYFRAYDDYVPLKRGEKHTRLDASDLARLEPGLVGSYVGGITFDEWGVDASRLCVLNAIDAEENGARIFVHTTAQAIERDGDGYVVRARDRIAEKSVVARGKVIVNATGAWAPITASLGKLPASSVRVRPGKGIHITFERRLSNYGITCDAIDGRQIFVMPWQNMTTIGTTDDDYFGDLDQVIATSEEVRYLVQGVASVFPSIREARAIGTYAGVRPTLFAYGPLEDALSREHEIIDHISDGAPNLFSMIGGKLASFRLFAQEMSDRIAADLAPSSRCRTHERPLPGGEDVPDAIEVAERAQITPVAARRLIYRHGGRARLVTLRIMRKPDHRAIVCACEPVLEAEVRHVIQHEHARTVDDVARRTRLGLGACGGMRCAVRCGQILAAELGMPMARGLASARAFLERQARARIVAMGPAQARQEALAIAHMRSTLGIEKERA